MICRTDEQDLRRRGERASPGPGREPARGLEDRTVGLVTGLAGYSTAPPFHPHAEYPEYPFPGLTQTARNDAYAGVRALLQTLGGDVARYGHADWNPLGSIIRPGDCVVIKPNFVREFRETSAGDGDCLITHGAVLRGVVDYAWLALRGCGRLIIADAPQNDADFGVIRRLTGLDELRELYRAQLDFELEVYDLRPERAQKVDGVTVVHQRLAGDPAGYRRVDLGPHSLFAELGTACRQLYGSEYDTGETRRHHLDGRHEYLVSQTVLDADVVLSVPKFKTHKKVGLTVNLKNMVGINGNKNWLPHFRIGSAAEGGDEFARNGARQSLERWLMQRFRQVFPRLGFLRRPLARPLKALGRGMFGDTNRDTVRSGNWRGNDTAWRMSLDLNRILFYADRQGKLHPAPVRRFFSIVDGITAGEGDGPLNADPRKAGLVLGGGNPAAVDAACARVAGFDLEHLPIIAAAFAPHELPLAEFPAADVTPRTVTRAGAQPVDEWPAPLELRPHFGWTDVLAPQKTTGADS